MKSLSLFLRTAGQQFSVLTQRLMLALHVKRTAQLGAVLVLSLFVAMFITHALRTASAQQKKWTSSRAVLVVTSPLDEGDELTAQNTQRFNIPLAITPDDALENFAAGDTARFALQPNTTLTASMVSSAQETVTVPDGWRIVALPTDMPSPPLQLRDSVDVVAGQAVIAAGVLVVSLQPLTIAVPADVAASVASVAQLGEASLISAR
ncbi:unannotated protein [freshwater metagenome]|uniref:Unannotated protein n=1 Tax=freshwater metagenome TaxID=449393 RepID=A0A6J6NIY3_9ZZZZ|nr:hypothetical protein [Actinomycetota bacterium]